MARALPTAVIAGPNDYPNPNLISPVPPHTTISYCRKISLGHYSAHYTFQKHKKSRDLGLLRELLSLQNGNLIIKGKFTNRCLERTHSKYRAPLQNASPQVFYSIVYNTQTQWQLMQCLNEYKARQTPASKASLPDEEAAKELTQYTQTPTNQFKI